MSPAVVLIAPSIVITALLCVDCKLFVNLIDLVLFALPGADLWGSVYQTSAAYVIFSAATARYSCLIPPAEIPEAVCVRRLTRLIHASVVLVAFSCWAFNLSFGSNNTLRNWYVVMALIVVSPLGPPQAIVRGVSSIDLGEKFIRASLLISNGELWVLNHSRAPPGLSIIFLRF